MFERDSAESRLLKVLAVIAVVAVAGVLAIVPYRLYERDIRFAKVNAHRTASLVHVALSEMILTGADVTDLINRLQGVADLEIRLRKLSPGEKTPEVTSTRASSRVQGTLLTYTAPPILDRDGGTWIAEMQFDLSPLKRESVRLIVDLILAVLVGATVFSIVVFVLVRRTLILPLRTMATEIETCLQRGEPIRLPEFGSVEVRALARAVQQACAAAAPGGASPAR